MKQTIPIILTNLFFLLLLEGCYPLIDSYYRPSVDGGHTYEGACKMGARNVRLLIEGIEVNVSTETRHRDMWIFLTLKDVPYEQKIDIDEKEFHAYESGTDKQITMITGSKRTTTRSYRTSTITRPEQVFGPEQVFVNTIHVKLTFPDTGIESFYLVPPTVLIDGIEVEFPTIYFELKTWGGMAPLNC